MTTTPEGLDHDALRREILRLAVPALLTLVGQKSAWPRRSLRADGATEDETTTPVPAGLPQPSTSSASPTP